MMPAYHNSGNGDEDIVKTHNPLMFMNADKPEDKPNAVVSAAIDDQKL